LPEENPATSVETDCVLDELWPENLPEETVPSEEAITAREAYKLLKKDGENVLFIDVRTPAETEQGLPTLIDSNVPYVQKEWHEETFEWVVNNDFVPTIEERLEEKGLDKQSTLILICHEGSRSARAIELLVKEGYRNVYSVTGGIVNGWKASKLPWSNEPDIEQMHF
jgi:rhodanese-related sulfurtransferase